MGCTARDSVNMKMFFELRWNSQNRMKFGQQNRVILYQPRKSETCPVFVFLGFLSTIKKTKRFFSFGTKRNEKFRRGSKEKTQPRKKEGRKKENCFRKKKSGKKGRKKGRKEESEGKTPRKAESAFGRVVRAKRLHDDDVDNNDDDDDVDDNGHDEDDDDRGQRRKIGTKTREGGK